MKYFSLQLNLLQNIRFASALLELDKDIAIPVKWLDTFKHLNKYFDIPFKVCSGDCESMDIGYNHTKPEVSIGKIKRPLVFPMCMIEYCKWGHKERKFVFSGIMTKRKSILDKFIKNNPDENIEIKASTNGRTLPIKAWDDEYYKGLMKSEFVLCPDGDFVWTYRFFEAIICGAIPVIENKCDLYDGFFYYDMGSKDIVYREDMAKKNLELLKERFTL